MENPVIQIQNLKKSFNHQEVLKGIDLEVNAGEVIGYLGIFLTILKIHT